MAGKKTAAVLLAGGHGARMQSKIPKQFLLLAGHTACGRRESATARPFRYCR